MAQPQTTALDGGGRRWTSLDERYGSGTAVGRLPRRGGDIAHLTGDAAQALRPRRAIDRGQHARRRRSARRPRGVDAQDDRARRTSRPGTPTKMPSPATSSRSRASAVAATQRSASWILCASGLPTRCAQARSSAQRAIRRSSIWRTSRSASERCSRRSHNPPQPARRAS